MSNQTVLVVVDMQNGFLDAETRSIIPRVEALIRPWRSLGGPVVFTRFINQAGGQYERLINWKRLQTRPEIDICAELSRYADIIIDKHYYSAFTEEFKSMSAASRWDTLLLCGVATDSCILKTAVDAFELGLTPIIVADACASHGGHDIHEAALRILARFIGRDQLISSEEFHGRVAAKGYKPEARVP